MNLFVLVFYFLIKSYFCCGLPQEGVTSLKIPLEFENKFSKSLNTFNWLRNGRKAELCQYRNVPAVPPEIFNWWGAMGCYIYNPPTTFNSKIGPYITSNGITNEGHRYPAFFVNKTQQWYLFDINNETVVADINESFLSPETTEKWLQCSKDSEKCCQEMINTFDNIEGDCPATWDGWTCFPPASAGKTVDLVCSPHAYSGRLPSCHHFSSKQCFRNGTWNVQTDYSTCSVVPRLLDRNTFHITTLSVSIAASVPAIFIFFYYRKLRVMRVAVHRNLLIAIVIRNSLVLITKSVVILDELTSNTETVMSQNQWPCKLLAFSERLAANFVFTFMLIDGIYLHKLIAAVFRQEPNMKLIYLIGAIVSTVPAVTWAVVVSQYSDVHCWVVAEDNGYQWINDAPRLLMLFINTVLMSHIIWVLLTKLRRNSQSAHMKRTARITLFLMPLFGIPFLLTAVRPNTDSCTGEQVYYFFAYALDGLQGFLVAMLFCYFNKEVHEAIKLSWKRSKIHSMWTESFQDRRSTMNNRRTTFTTNVDPLPGEKNHSELGRQSILNMIHNRVSKPIHEDSEEHDDLSKDKINMTLSGTSLVESATYLPKNINENEVLNVEGSSVNHLTHTADIYDQIEQPTPTENIYDEVHAPPSLMAPKTQNSSNALMFNIYDSLYSSFGNNNLNIASTNKENNEDPSKVTLTNSDEQNENQGSDDNPVVINPAKLMRSRGDAVVFTD